MNDHRTKAPRLFVFVHFAAAAGILLGGLVARSLTSASVDSSWVMPLAALACALEVGIGIGEWRGMRYANYVRAQATSGA